MMVLEKGSVHASAKISHIVSCNISLYRDTKEVIYRYTQNVYCCNSNSYTLTLPIQSAITRLDLQVFFLRTIFPTI